MSSATAPAGTWNGLDADFRARLVRITPSDLTSRRHLTHAGPGPVAVATPAAPQPAHLLRAGRQRRDETKRHLIAGTTDSQHRVGFKKLTHHVGWDNTTKLVLELCDEYAVLRRGVATPLTAWLADVRLDRESRLGLPAATRSTLGINAGDTVLAAVIPDWQEIRIWAAADVLTALTGVEIGPNPEEVAVHQKTPQMAPPSRIKPARFA